MKVLEFIFAIIGHFVKLEGGRMTQLRDEAFAWENKKKQEGTTIGKLLIKSEAWYFQIALALFSIVGIKSISNYLMSTPAELTDDSEDDDDDNLIPMLFNKRQQKFVINQ